MIEATLRRGKDDGPWRYKLRQVGPNAYRGEKNFSVNSADPAAILSEAVGLPAYGDPWSAQYPGVFVVDIEPINTGGKPYDLDNSPPLGPWTRVRVLYATPGAAGTVEVPTLGLKFRRKRSSAEHVLVHFFEGADSDPTIDQRRINNGEGTTKRVGLTGYDVVHYLNPADPIDEATLIQLARRKPVHFHATEKVTLPRLYGVPGSTPLVLDSGEVQYDDYEIEPVDGLVRLTHSVHCAPDFLYRYGRTDVNGKVAEIIAGPLYEEADLSGVLS